MFLTDRKLQRRMDEVKKYRYRGVTPIGDFLMCEDEQKAVNPQVPVNFDGWGRIARERTGRQRQVSVDAQGYPYSGRVGRQKSSWCF